MSNIRAYLVDGLWYLGVERNGQVYLISLVGRAGDCLRF